MASPEITRSINRLMICCHIGIISEFTSISGVQNATYSFDEEGAYEIVLNVSNDDCSDIKTVTIIVAHKTTSIETVDGQKISFHPNPVSNILHIETDLSIVVEFIDGIGKTILRTSDKNINIENIYFFY